MKLYRVNKLAGDDGKIVKKIDMLANNDQQALRTAGESDDCPVCEVWSEGQKIGSVK